MIDFIKLRNKYIIIKLNFNNISVFHFLLIFRYIDR
jgi:hypothetical protein